MATQLNIKDEVTVRLARDLAAAAGETVTQTIRRALEERAARVEEARAAKYARLTALMDNMQGVWRPEFDAMELSTRHGELLYDEDGIPV